jgi:ribonuclease D
LDTLGQALPKDEQKTFEYGKDLTPNQMKYAINDTAVLPEIFEKQKVLLQQQGLIETAVLEIAIIPAVARVELAGMCIDQNSLGYTLESTDISVLSPKQNMA